MFKLIMLAAALCISGCTLTGGQTEYTIEPVIMADGSTVCCKVRVFNSKDYDKLKFKLVKQSDGSITVELDEKGVSASTPAAVMSENNGKLLDAVNGVVSKL